MASPLVLQLALSHSRQVLYRPDSHRTWPRAKMHGRWACQRWNSRPIEVTTLKSLSRNKWNKSSSNICEVKERSSNCQHFMPFSHTLKKIFFYPLIQTCAGIAGRERERKRRVLITYFVFVEENSPASLTQSQLRWVRFHAIKKDKHKFVSLSRTHTDVY